LAGCRRGSRILGNKKGGKIPALSQSLPVPKAAPAERPGMPAGRAIVHRAATAIGTAVPAGAAAAGDADDVGRCGLIERSQRHGPRRGDRRKAEANGKRRCNKYLHSPSFPLNFAATRQLRTWPRPSDRPATRAASPVAAVPAVPAPMPAPVTAAPVPMTVPVMSPVDLLGLQMLNFGLRRHRGMNIRIRWRPLFIRAKRLRRQRRGLRARAERGGPGGKSNGKLQKVAAFHDISLFGSGE
jgi:hypothetical protein